MIEFKYQNAEEPGGADFKKMMESSYINPSAEIKKPPIALSLGVHQYNGRQYPAHFGSYGDFSCVVGASKSKKTFFLSMLKAAFLGGNANHYTESIKAFNTKGKYLILFDTEQSNYHVQRVVKRVCGMVGAVAENFKAFALRRYTPEERFRFIEYVITKSEYCGKIGLLCIDGYADLVSDFNSQDQAKEVENKLLNWTQTYNMHITGALHRNFGSQKPVGHLGSMILKKAETVAFVETANGITKVKCEYARNPPFDDFYFTINNNWLPEEANAQTEQPVAPATTYKI